MGIRARAEKRNPHRDGPRGRDPLLPRPPHLPLKMWFSRQHLIIDADDTLWENNIYFERAFDEFVGFLSHSSLAAAEIRAILDEIEVANARIHGYGSLNY